MQNIGLKILLKGGGGADTHIADVMPYQEATNLVQSFVKGEMKGVITRKNAAGWEWAIRVEDIQAMHTFLVQEISVNSGLSGRLPPNASGFPY